MSFRLNASREWSGFALVAGALALLGVSSPAFADDSSIIRPETMAMFAATPSVNLNAKPCEVRVVINQEKFTDILPKLIEHHMVGNEMTESEAMTKVTSLEAPWSVQMAAFVLRQTYRQNPKLDECHFVTSTEAPDDFGNIHEHPIASFDFSRALYAKVNWDHMETRNLMNIAPHFKLSPWFLEQFRKEAD